MFNKIKTFKLSNTFERFSDIRALGLMAFVVIIILVTWSGVKAVQTNYDLQKQIAELQQQNQVSELQNQNQKLKNEYLNTDQFLELSARRQFGLAAPGEKVVLIPPTVALAHTKDLASTPKVNTPAPVVTKPAYQRNFEAWVDFFLHRPNH
jgi:cell division protein FtsB